MALDPDREVYPNAPLRFVSFEARFPAAPGLSTQETRRELFGSLRDVFPISQSAPPQMELQLMPGAQPVVQSGGDQLLLVDRRRERAVTIGTRALLVQTTAYTRYEEFAEWVALAVGSLQQTGEVSAIERIGLRYTDEIRIGGIDSPERWQPYVHASLIGPVDALSGVEAHTTQGLVEFEIDSQRRLVLRYGANRGWMVAPNGILRTRTADDGPYFLLDLDSFWISPQDEIPTFEASAILSIADDLHTPVRQVFEAVITNKLRNDVLRREPSGS